MDATERRCSRRRFLEDTARLSVSAAGIMLLAGCQTSPSGPVAASSDLETTRLRVVQTPSMCQSPQYVAQDLLRSEGFEVHGQISHPDPYAAARQTMEDERVDEIIVSTFPGARSGWLRRDLVERLRADTNLPVVHIEVDVPVEVTA